MLTELIIERARRAPGGGAMSNPHQQWPEQAGDRTVEAPTVRRQPGQPAPGHPQQYSQPQYQQPQYDQPQAYPPPAPQPAPAAPAPAPGLPERFWLKLYAVTLAAVLTGGLLLMFAGYQLVNWKIDQLSDDVRSDLSDLGGELGDLGLPGLGG